MKLKFLSFAYINNDVVLPFSCATQFFVSLAFVVSGFILTPLIDSRNGLENADKPLCRQRQEE